MKNADCDLLVFGGTVLSMEDQCEPLTDAAVAIADGEIIAVGSASELSTLAANAERVDASGCLIMPGLVNTHSHLAMTLLRGIADDLPLMEWLEHFIWPAERQHMDRDTVRVGTQLAAVEQLLAGVTTTTDMYFFGNEVAAVLDEAGMRAVVCESLIDFPTPRCKNTEEMVARQRELAVRYAHHPRITPSLAAHAPYTVCAANLVTEAEMAEELGLPLQIHISETRGEVERMLQERGVSPVQYLADLGVLSERVIAAHCVHLSPQDIETLFEFEVGVSHNPASNLKLASGIAPVPQMHAAGVKLGLGTDGCASNNTLDILRDMQLAAFVHKGVTGDPTVLPSRSMVEMATIGGARVLGLEKQIGSLTPGKRADLICLALEDPHTVPQYDPFSHLVWAARAHDVRDVVVDGRVVVRNRVLTTLDMERVLRQTREVADRIGCA